jgi:hypothetical protein
MHSAPGAAARATAAARVLTLALEGLGHAGEVRVQRRRSAV